MKILAILLLCLLFVIPNLAQSKDLSAIKKEIKSFKDNRWYFTTYEKDWDRTIVSFSSKLNKGSIGMGSTDGLNLSLNFLIDGQTLEQTVDQFALKFKIKYNISSETPVSILADNEKFELINEDILNSKLKVFRTGVLSLGFFSFLIEREVLVKIAKAQTIIIKVGEVQFTLKPEDQKVFKDILIISEVK